MTPTVAFVFPGQGSQSLGMLADLADVHAVVRETFDEASEATGVDLWALAQDGPQAQLDRTEFTQPALLAAGIAVWRAWCQADGPKPQWLAGHSLGEYAALVAAGAISLGQGARLVRLRGQLMQDATPDGSGAMAAVLGADEDVVREICEAAAQSQVLVPANFNSPGQIVIGGNTEAVDRAMVLLNDRGVRKVVKLAVSVPSHTPLMRDKAQRLAEAMQALDWRVPEIPVVQNVDASVHDNVDAILEALVQQLYRPVQWTACVETLVANGVTRIGECGPGKVLTGLIKRIDREVDGRALGSSAQFTSALEAWV